MMTQPPDELLACLRSHERFLITAHRSPDGDAIGATLGLSLGLQALGKECETINSDGVPRMCHFLPRVDQVLRAPTRDDHQVALVVDVDTARWERVAVPAEALDRCPLTVVVDHHASSRPTGDVNWIDPTLCAAGEMVYHLLTHLPDSLTGEVAECLYAAVATDTGAFRYRNTSAEALTVAAELVRLGADPSLTARHLFEERALSARRLLGIALHKLECEEPPGITWSTLTRADFAESGATPEDAEGIVNFVQGVEGVLVGALFRESEGDEIRVSLRASPPMDVAAVAQQFGGGGHALAAGCRLPGPLESARDAVLDAIRKALRRPAAAT